jgi:hypothetical protein
MTDLGHWIPKVEIPDSTYGFVYMITNLTDNKKYIGKKQMVTTRKMPPLKGKKNKRHKEVETDWRTYTSSSNELNADILKYGKENFKFEILIFCNSKWQLAYYETKLQFAHDVLISEKYYNGIINCRIGKAPKGHIINE